MEDSSKFLELHKETGGGEGDQALHKLPSLQQTSLVGMMSRGLLQLQVNTNQQLCSVFFICFFFGAGGGGGLRKPQLLPATQTTKPASVVKDTLNPQPRRRKHDKGLEAGRWFGEIECF